jgi:hypothetical protein
MAITSILFQHFFFVIPTFPNKTVFIQPPIEKNNYNLKFEVTSKDVANPGAENLEKIAVTAVMGKFSDLIIT